MTKRVTVEQAQAELPQLLAEAVESGERIIIERPGQPPVALVSATEPAAEEPPGQPDSWVLALRSSGPVDYTDEDIDEMVAHIYALRYAEMGRPVDLDPDGD